MQLQPAFLASAAAGGLHAAEHAPRWLTLPAGAAAAAVICSDKTGTLTTNMMSAVSFKRSVHCTALRYRVPRPRTPAHACIGTALPCSAVAELMLAPLRTAACLLVLLALCGCICRCCSLPAAVLCVQVLPS